MMRLLAVVALVVLCLSPTLPAQSLGTAGTLEGSVTDPSGAAIPNAEVSILNRLSNFRRTIRTDVNGAFRITNIPPNPYHLEASAASFNKAEQDVIIRNSVPVSVKLQLTIAGTQTAVTVESAGADLLENVPYAHNDVDTHSLSQMPISSPASGLSDAIMLGSGAVAADSNGFFHPLGDHAQTSFSIDGQPISDQQSKNFSTQIPLDAIQSMELITGAPPAEYGDKTSLVVNAVTRSGLGQKTHASLLGQYSSFATYSEEGTLGFGNAKFGNFLAFNALRSGRFLDTPEFLPLHAKGNNGTIFDRVDYQPTVRDIFHVNIFAARNWFQIPNTYDQLQQDQRQKISTFNFAPGYQHTFNASSVLTVNPFIRTDRVNYYPSRDPENDTPATLAQNRTLTNIGFKADISYVRGRHDVKVGTQIMQTRLHEAFSLGITESDPDLPPGLLPFDLALGGKMFQFAGAKNINQGAFYIQDSIKLKQLTVQAGLRVDRYAGISSATGVQPRIGLSYLLSHDTVLRGSYSKTFETPYNENLILSSSTGQGGLANNVFGAEGSQPLKPGTRNQFNLGIQQAVKKYFVADADYFWKYTDSAYDFGNLFNTPIHFPIAWKKSKIDGVAIRIGSPNLHGFQWFTTMGHTRARYFGPETGGLIFNSGVSDNVFRIDHDQAFQQRTNIRYQHGKTGPWIAFTWRYESGLVAGAVGDLEDALALTGAQQAAIGFNCGGAFATRQSPLTAAACTPQNFGATRLRIPAEGTADDDHNPPRISPRHMFDIGVGTDNLFRTERIHTVLRFNVINLTNNVALYNFLSTFSGTHFVAPRTYQVTIGITL